jgi:vancomycin resistance protein YoaR
VTQPNDTTHRRRHARTRSNTKSSAGRPRAGLYVAIALLAAIAVGFLAIAADVAFTQGRIHPHVSVGGVAVGGMTEAQAAAVLAKALPAKSSRHVGVSYQDHTWTIRPAQLGMTFDGAALASSAMAYGRSAGFFGDIGQRIRAMFGSVALPATASVDPERLNGFIDKIAETTDVAPTDAGVKMQGLTGVVTRSKSGMALDRARLTEMVLTAFTSTARTVAAPVNVRQPDVNDQAAEAARALATSMVASPAKVVWGTRSWTLSQSDLAKMLAFRKVPGGQAVSATSALEPYVSASTETSIFEPRLGVAADGRARDARFRARNGVVKIIPSSTGVGPDFTALSVALTEVLKSPVGAPRAVELHTRKTEPKISTAMARKMNIHERISSFTTAYDPSVKPRVNNIHVLGDALDGKLIAPGATFSFNKAVGERTAAKGYQVANVIVSGKLEQALGGGICQVGTTMFNAVFKSGLPVIERHNHSFYISHYPKGRDATVSWNGPDLKFKNDTNTWMLIATSYTPSSISIALYGTNPGYSVESTTSAFYDETPFPTETVKDPTLHDGQKVVEDVGETGRTCIVTRIVKLNGRLVRRDTFKSVYKPKIEVVHVGNTKPPKSGNTTSTQN